MSGFTGTRCMVCNDKFTKDDDIVVCPECGTPYHRLCYGKSGSCVNIALHESGRSWQPSYDVGEDTAVYDDVRCKNCGEINPPMTLFCEKCGSPLSTLELHIRNLQNMRDNNAASAEFNNNPGAFNRNEYRGVGMSPFLINFSDKYCGYNPDEDFDGVKLSELGDYVDTNTHYYLPLFKIIKDSGRNFSWNFIAILFPELYFSHRKMPLIAFGIFLFRIIFWLPYFIEILNFRAGAEGSELIRLASYFDVRSSAFQLLSLIINIVTYAGMFIIGLNSNYIYYRHSVKKIKKIKTGYSVSGDETQLNQVFRKKGGTSAVLMALFVILDIMPYVLSMYLMSF